MIKSTKPHISLTAVLRVLKIFLSIACVICAFGLWLVVHMFDVGTTSMELTLGSGVLCVMGFIISVLGYKILDDHKENAREDYGFIERKGK
jgi:peptidoglycan biosynthesis protein MviN/MurJ (putative lipid II flippase)